jgi:hypothetical protein
MHEIRASGILQTKLVYIRHYTLLNYTHTQLTNPYNYTKIETFAHDYQYTHRQFKPIGFFSWRGLFVSVHTQFADHKCARNLQLIFVHDSVQYTQLLLFVLGWILAYDYINVEFHVFFNFTSAREVHRHFAPVHVRAFDSRPEIFVLFVLIANLDDFHFG